MIRLPYVLGLMEPLLFTVPGPAPHRIRYSRAGVDFFDHSPDEMPALAMRPGGSPCGCVAVYRDYHREAFPFPGVELPRGVDSTILRALFAPFVRTWTEQGVKIAVGWAPAARWGSNRAMIQVEVAGLQGGEVLCRFDHQGTSLNRAAIERYAQEHLPENGTSGPAGRRQLTLSGTRTKCYACNLTAADAAGMRRHVDTSRHVARVLEAFLAPFPTEMRALAGTLDGPAVTGPVTVGLDPTQRPW
jgi:hypothetical protein